jgi:hypothetical protein
MADGLAGFLAKSSTSRSHLKSDSKAIEPPMNADERGQHQEQLSKLFLFLSALIGVYLRLILRF